MCSQWSWLRQSPRPVPGLASLPRAGSEKQGGVQRLSGPKGAPRGGPQIKTPCATLGSGGILRPGLPGLGVLWTSLDEGNQGIETVQPQTASPLEQYARVSGEPISVLLEAGSGAPSRALPSAADRHNVLDRGAAGRSP